MSVANSFSVGHRQTPFRENPHTYIYQVFRSFAERNIFQSLVFHVWPEVVELPRILSQSKGCMLKVCLRTSFLNLAHSCMRFCSSAFCDILRHKTGGSRQKKKALHDCPGNSNIMLRLVTRNKSYSPIPMIGHPVIKTPQSFLAKKQLVGFKVVLRALLSSVLGKSSSWPTLFMLA